MRDLHVNISGPRDRARQNVSFQVAQSAPRPTLDAAEVGRLIAQMREGLAHSQLAAEELRRVERRLATIEEEAQSQTPVWGDINESLTFLGKVAETAHGLAPVFSSAFRALAATVGCG